MKQFKDPNVFDVCVCQGSREASGEWRDDRVVSGGSSGAPGGEGASGGGLHVFWSAAAVHHRYTVRPGILYLIRYPM